METIRDGKGRGYLAGVTDESMLMTRSVMVPTSHHHAVSHANAYVCTTEHKLQAANTKEIVCTLEYSGEEALVLSRASFNSSAAGLTDFYVYGGTTLSGTPGGIELPLYNTNSGSRNLIDCTVLGTDEGTYPIVYESLGGKMWEVFMGYHMMTHFELKTDDAFIIKPGTFITFAAKSQAVDDKVGINLFFYEEHAEI